MNELEDLTIEELKLYKQFLIGEIKERQRKTMEIDKKIREVMSGNI